MPKNFEQAPITEQEKEELLALINAHPNHSYIKWYRKGYRKPILLIARKSKKRDVIYYDAVGELIAESNHKVNLIFSTIKKYGLDQLRVSIPTKSHQYVAKQFDTSKGKSPTHEDANYHKYKQEFHNLKQADHIKTKTTEFKDKIKTLDIETIIMEYFNGETIDNRRFNYPLVINILKALKKQVLDKGNIHNDIKPANIIANYSTIKSVKIIDFDASTKLGESSLFGTFGYAAPERKINTKITGKSDVFSIGVVILEMFIKHNSLIEGKHALRLKEELDKYKHLQDINADLGHHLDQIAGYQKLILEIKLDSLYVDMKQDETHLMSLKETLIKMLKCSPSERYSIDEAIAAFEDLHIDYKKSRNFYTEERATGEEMAERCIDMSATIKNIYNIVSQLNDSENTIKAFAETIGLDFDKSNDYKSKSNIINKINKIKEECESSFKLTERLVDQLNYLLNKINDKTASLLLKELITSLKQEIPNVDEIDIYEMKRLSNKYKTKLCQIMYELCLVAINNPIVKSYCCDAIKASPEIFSQHDTDNYGLIEFALIQNNNQLLEFLTKELGLNSYHIINRNNYGTAIDTSFSLALELAVKFNRDFDFLNFFTIDMHEVSLFKNVFLTKFNSLPLAWKNAYIKSQVDFERLLLCECDISACDLSLVNFQNICLFKKIWFFSDVDKVRVEKFIEHVNIQLYMLQLASNNPLSDKLLTAAANELVLKLKEYAKVEDAAAKILFNQVLFHPCWHDNSIAHTFHSFFRLKNDSLPKQSKFQEILLAGFKDYLPPRPSMHL